MSQKLNAEEANYYNALRDRLRQLPDYVVEDDLNLTRSKWAKENEYLFVKLLALRGKCSDANRVCIMERAFSSVETVEALLADKGKEELEDSADQILLKRLFE